MLMHFIPVMVVTFAIVTTQKTNGPQAYSKDIQQKERKIIGVPPAQITSAPKRYIAKSSRSRESPGIKLFTGQISAEITTRKAEQMA